MTRPTTPTGDRRPAPGGTGRLGDHVVARIGYGAMQLERLESDPAAAAALVRRAVERGVTHVDTAHFYGDGTVNAMLRDALRPEDGVTLVTKVGADRVPGAEVPLRPAQRPEELRASVETNLRTLGVDRLDVVNLRRLELGPGLRAGGDQVVDVDDQLAVLVELRDAGTIGAVGLSAVTADTVRRGLAAGVVGVQNAYSVLDRSGEDVLDLCRDAGLAFVPFFPLGSAFDGLPNVADDPTVREVAARHDATPAQVGLAWLLQHAPEVLLIPGTATAAHLDENLAAGDLVLTADDVAVLDALAPAGTATAHG